MYAFLLTLLILDGLLLGAVVLLQAGQGGGLASMGGGTTDLVVGGRQAATLLTKMSWICGSAFLVLSLLLSLIAPSRGGSSEVLDRLRQSQAPSAPANLPIQTSPTAPAAGSAPAGTTPVEAAPTTPAPAKPAN
jgi:preprotein translocase subunit SecG